MAPPQSSVTTGTDALQHLLGMMEAFKAFDSDGDGLITAQELQGTLASLGYNASESEVQEMMNRAGLMGLEEFLAIATNARELGLGNLASQLQAALLELGPEGDEAVTGEELYEALSTSGGLSYEECMVIIAALDSDGDGCISLEDLGAIVQALL